MTHVGVTMLLTVLHAIGWKGVMPSIEPVRRHFNFVAPGATRKALISQLSSHQNTMSWSIAQISHELCCSQKYKRALQLKSPALD